MAGKTPATEQGARMGRVITTVFAASAFTLAGNQLYALSFFLLLPAVSVGLINWATATAAIVFYILDGGIETAVVIAAKAHPIRLRTLAVVVGAFRSGAALLALLALVTGALTHTIGGAEVTVLTVVGAAALVRLLYTPFTAVLQVNDRQGDVAVLGLVGTAIKLCSLLLLWLLAAATVTTLLVAGLLSELTTLLALAWVARIATRVGEAGIDWRVFTGNVLHSAPGVALSQAALIAQARVDWLLVVAFASYTAVASYALANKAVEMIVLAGSIFGRAALPWFVEGWASRNVGQPVRWLIVITNTVSLALAVAGWPIVRFVFHTKYLAAEPVIPVLAAIGPALVLFQILQFAVMGGRCMLDVVVAASVAVTAQLSVDLLAIPSLGILGAAYGMCTFAAVGLSILVTSAWRRRLVPGHALSEMVVGSLALPAFLVVASAMTGWLR